LRRYIKEKEKKENKAKEKEAGKGKSSKSAKKEKGKKGEKKRKRGATEAGPSNRYLFSLLKLSVGGTCPSYLHEIGGLLTEGSRSGRTFGESVGGILEMDSSDWSNGIRHHVFDIRPDTEFKHLVHLNHLRGILNSGQGWVQGQNGSS
jgi:hypothetical protein